MVQWIASSPEKLVDFTIPGSNPTTTFTIYLYLDQLWVINYEVNEWTKSWLSEIIDDD